jgi:hypothetical protein
MNTVYTCECSLSFANEKKYDKHRTSKLHELRLKYLPDQDNKVRCPACDISIDIYQYENHLCRAKHLEKSNQDIPKVKCIVCGKSYREQNYESHLNSIAHKNKMKIKNDKKELNLQQYEELKDQVNCCCECKHVNVNQSNYNTKYKMCNYCYELSLGSTKTCICCKETKPCNLFERPKMVRCKKCVREKIKTKKKDLKI